MATKERLVIESMFRIADKEGNNVDFLLNPAQAKLDAYLTGRDIIPKARQLGISSYYLARFLAKCLIKVNTRAVVISHDTESTQRMLNKVHYMLEHIRGPKAVIKNSSKNELTFPKTGSMFYIGTAGSRKFGRGDTITDLHCSEVAYWEDPKSLLKGLFQAVPLSGEIGMESTGNGVGNYYHKTCMRAATNQSRFKMHFFNWIDFPEYTVALSEEEQELVLNNLNADWEEDKLVQTYGVTAGQIAWRRGKLDELDYDLSAFKQEYPVTLDECFQATGFGIFKKVNFVDSPDWKRVDQFLWAMESFYAQPTSSYLISVDVGGGVGSDNSVIQVIDLNRWEQVAEWVSNTIGPDSLSVHIKNLAKHYNDAYVVVESNNHGAVTLLELCRIYPLHLIYSEDDRKDRLVDYGIRTTTRTKPAMIGSLKKELSHDLVIHSPLLKNELDTFVEKDGGKLEAQEGCQDDRVMALAVCMLAINSIALVVKAMKEDGPSSILLDPFGLEALQKEFFDDRGSGGWPIPPQHRLN